MLNAGDLAIDLFDVDPSGFEIPGDLVSCVRAALAERREHVAEER